MYEALIVGGPHHGKKLTLEKLPPYGVLQLVNPLQYNNPDFTFRIGSNISLAKSIGISFYEYEECQDDIDQGIFVFVYKPEISADPRK